MGDRTVPTQNLRAMNPASHTDAMAGFDAWWKQMSCCACPAPERYGAEESKDAPAEVPPVWMKKEETARKEVGLPDTTQKKANEVWC